MKIKKETRERLAKRIKAAREACGYSQGQVARRLGWQRPTVSYIESGARAVSALELLRFAVLFDVPLADFVEGL